MCLINGFSEQPSGKINGWTRLYTSVYAGPLVLDAAAFYCPDLTVCADGSLLEPALQFMLNPKVSFDTPCGTLSGGMIFFTDFVSSEKNAAAEPEVLNLKTAVRFQKKNLLLSLYAAYKNNFFAGEEIKSAKFSLSRSFKKIKPSLSVSIKEEKKRKIFSASVSALFKSLPLNQLSLNLENEREETKLSASLLFTGGSRSLRWNAKFSAEIK